MWNCLFSRAWPMMKTVVLFGTSHTYQIPGDAESQFQAAIEKVCSNQNIRSIAEEFSAEELTNRNVDASISEQLAKRIGIPHRYCDLNNKERLARGVQHENIIRSDGWMKNWDEDRIDHEVRASHLIREKCWLEQILAMDCWPTLFICGANHVRPFKELLHAHGITVQIIKYDWVPLRRSSTR